MKFTVNRPAFYVAMFLLICLVYGAGSTPSPDSIGLPEIAIGFLLVILVGWQGLASLAGLRDAFADRFVPGYVRLSAAYLLVVPSIHGLFFMDNSLADFVRDFVPMIYMLLPLLILHKIGARPELWLSVTVVGLCMIGFLFAVRFFLDIGGGIVEIGSRPLVGTNRDNPMQYPAMLFFLSFTTCAGVYMSLKGKRFLLGLVLLLVSVVPWTVMIASVMRAPIALTLIAVVLVALWPVRGGRITPQSLLFVMAGGVAVVAFSPGLIVEGVLGGMDLLVKKTTEHGLNARDIEAMAVLSNIDSVPVLLFGEGLGGLISNPIGDGGGWRFVHNYFLYFLFKTGIVGLMALFAYLFWMARIVWRSDWRDEKNFLILVSMLSPVGVAMLLEPSFKSMSFGFLLFLVPLLGVRKAYSSGFGYVAGK